MIDYKRSFSAKRGRICAALQPIIVAMMVAGISGALMVMLGFMASYLSRHWQLGLAPTRPMVADVASSKLGMPILGRQ